MTIFSFDISFKIFEERINMTEHLFTDKFSRITNRVVFSLLSDENFLVYTISFDI